MPLPIETVYENNNEGSHFRAFRDSARIYGVIFSGFFRFVGTSMVSFLLDYGLYLLFNNLLKYFGTSLDRQVGILFIRVVRPILIATVAARILSGVTNFFLNRNFVFTDKGKVSRAFLRYLGVFFLVMLLSAVLTSSLHLVAGLERQHRQDPRGYRAVLRELPSAAPLGIPEKARQGGLKKDGPSARGLPPGPADTGRIRSSRRGSDPDARRRRRGP